MQAEKLKRRTEQMRWKAYRVRVYLDDAVAKEFEIYGTMYDAVQDLQEAMQELRESTGGKGYWGQIVSEDEDDES